MSRSSSRLKQNPRATTGRIPEPSGERGVRLGFVGVEVDCFHGCPPSICCPSCDIVTASFCKQPYSPVESLESILNFYKD